MITNNLFNLNFSHFIPIKPSIFFQWTRIVFYNEDFTKVA